MGEGEGEVGAELGSRDCDTDLGGWEGNHYSELQQLRVCHVAIASAHSGGT